MRAFLAAEVPFSVAVLEFEGGLNRHDCAYVLQLCEQLDLDVKRYRLDLLRFVQGPLLRVCDRYKLRMPAVAPQIWLAEQIEGVPVFGGGDLYIGRSTYETELFVEFQTSSTAIARSLLAAQREGYPYFFVHTPELVLSYLLHPLLQVFVHTSFCMRITNFKRFRHPIYRHSWPELGVQRRNANGWELLRPYYDQLLRQLTQRYSPYNTPVRIGLLPLMRRLSAQPDTELAGIRAPRVDPLQLDHDLWPVPDGVEII